MHFTEVEKQQNEEIYDFAYVDISGVQPLRVGKPAYDWVRKMVADLPQGKAIYVALPEGVRIQVFQDRLRSLLLQWKQAYDWRWSIRRDCKGRGVYLLKAIPRTASGAQDYLSTHPETLTSLSKETALRLSRSRKAAKA